MKELLRECDELRLSRDEALARAKETENKLKALEADTQHLHEVLASRQLKPAPARSAWFRLLNSIFFYVSYCLRSPGAAQVVRVVFWSG